MDYRDDLDEHEDIQEECVRSNNMEKLYEKASTQFSIQKTVSTQLQIYASILRRHRRRSSARDGVVICGAYGRGNAGDDAILEAILQEMRLSLIHI